jgi:hypothetical protein
MELAFEIEENWGTDSDEQSLLKSLNDAECSNLFAVRTPPPPHRHIWAELNPLSTFLSRSQNQSSIFEQYLGIQSLIHQCRHLVQPTIS